MKVGLGIVRLTSWIRQALGGGSAESGPVGAGSFSSGPHTYWGAHTFFRTFKPLDSIRIGAYCSIADRVHIIAGGNHNVNSLSAYPFSLLDDPPQPSREPQPEEAVCIGNDVWIGTNVTIIGNVTVGDGAVIAAGAVLVSDVEPYCVVGGVPARLLSRRLEAADARSMVELEWWNWDEDLVREAEPLLRGNNIAALAAFAQSRGL